MRACGKTVFNYGGGGEHERKHKVAAQLSVQCRDVWSQPVCLCGGRRCLYGTTHHNNWNLKIYLKKQLSCLTSIKQRTNLLYFIWIIFFQLKVFYTQEVRTSRTFCFWLLPNPLQAVSPPGGQDWRMRPQSINEHTSQNTLLYCEYFLIAPGMFYNKLDAGCLISMSYKP